MQPVVDEKIIPSAADGFNPAIDRRAYKKMESQVF
jgi:hypothetical protein